MNKGKSDEQVRLNKYMAQCGICSRREADKLVEQGKVSVNGQIAELGTQVVPGKDIVQVNGKTKEAKREKKAVIAFYKPVGVTCSEKDAHAERLIMDMIHYPVRVTYAGRLDKDSEGLMILTNDGDLISAMMRGANRHEKEYVVKVDKEITPEFLRRMEQGIFLKDLDITTRECKLSQDGKYTFHIVLTQGVNRQIRRMCKALGYEVKSLKRIRIMNIELGSLKNGSYRELTEEELVLLYSKCGMQSK